MPAAPSVPGFNLERPLASGRHGAVWAARRRGDDAAVALKLCRPSGSAMRHAFCARPTPWPQRMWVCDHGFGLIFTADGGRTWRMLDGAIAAAGSQVRHVAEPEPHLLVGGQGCLWRLDAGPAGAALFDRPCSIIP